MLYIYNINIKNTFKIYSFIKYTFYLKLKVYMPVYHPSFTAIIFTITITGRPYTIFVKLLKDYTVK